MGNKPLEELVKLYAEEAECPLAAEELIEEYELLPMREKGEVIGFFGVFFANIKRGPTAVVNLIYILPEHRDNRGTKVVYYFRDMVRKMKNAGIEYVEVNAHPAHARQIRKHSKLKPLAHRFIGKAEDYLEGFEQ